MSFHVFSNVFQRQAVLPGKYTFFTVAKTALGCALVFSLEESSQDDFFLHVMAKKIVMVLFQRLWDCLENRTTVRGLRQHGHTLSKSIPETTETSLTLNHSV